ncbi:uncharacterized protein HD556DRAFT_1539393 [Suillus plorans]|uniref:Uncharacterized protein n=1 Tax=Suillus plorans TaxID=116603 RepID=A0A9P7AEK4_9AGAM|nr:uncharacterized protein HD556DRAFT_1539393 [Suillus plorans]KAG1786837.1 hypothetical protein HD556DRAFT_1539393 [Suillus plorans]
MYFSIYRHFSTQCQHIYVSLEPFWLLQERVPSRCSLVEVPAEAVIELKRKLLSNACPVHEGLVSPRIRCTPFYLIHRLVFGESLEVQYSCACDRLELTVARYDAHTPQYFTWVERNLGQCALALLKHYKDPESEVLSRTFYAVSAKLNYTQFASSSSRESVDLIFLLPSALGEPVSFVSSATTGMQEMDDMYDFLSEFGLYPDTVISDPRLINVGVKFHTMEGISQEIKGRYVRILTKIVFCTPC